MRIAILAATVLVCGCAQTASQYAPSIENVQRLRDSGAGRTQIGRFEAESREAKVNAITLRGSPLVSPYGEKYTSYLEEALRTEFRAAQLLDDKATLEIGGVLLKNDVNVAGFTEGYAEMEARVVVKRDGQARYDRVKYTKIVFESSFAGAIAIPRGVQAYPELVAKFLSDLYADKEFIAALR